MSLDSVAFPEQVRAYFQEHPVEAEDENGQLIKIFQESVGAKEEFLTWAKAHPSLVERTPRLYHTLELIDSTGWQATAARIKQSFWLPADSCLDLINDVLSKKENTNLGSVPDNYASMALELFEAGIINKEQVLKLFSQRLNNDLLPLMKENVLKSALPLLHRQQPDFLAEIFALSNDFERTVLHFPETFTLALPLLDKLAANHLVSLFSLNVRTGNINLPIENALSSEEAILLLDKLNLNDLVAILTGVDREGNTPFVRAQMSEATMTFLIKKLGFDNIVNIYTIESNLGKTPLQNEKTFKSIFPILVKMLDSKDILKIVAIKNSGGHPVLHDSQIATIAINCIKKKFDLKDIIRICEIQDKAGNTLLIDEGTFKSIFPLIFKKYGPQSLHLLGLQDGRGYTPLFFPSIYMMAYPFLTQALLNKQFEIEDFFKLLSINAMPKSTLILTPLTWNTEATISAFTFLLQNYDMEDILKIYNMGIRKENHHTHFECISSELGNLIAKHGSQSVLKLLAVQDRLGRTPLDYQHIFESTIKEFQNNNLNLPDEFFKLFTVKNRQGKIPLDNVHNFKKALPLLTLMSDEQLDQLFSIKDAEGNTLLDNPEIIILLDNPKIIEEARPLFDRNIPAFQILKCQASDVWLVKDKAPIDFKSLSEEEYQEKAVKLKENLDNLWNSFVFGEEEGNISKGYLTLRIANKNETFTSEQLKEKLDLMLDKITKKTPWLGTPPETDTKGLHIFYSQMLANFEELLSLIDGKSPEEQAGPLINIAQVEFEGRCATGYQEEIRQAKKFFSNSKELGLEENFSELAQDLLNATIETIVERNYHGSVHAFSQMLYSVGLASAPDLLTPVSTERCHEMIKEKWTRGTIVSSLTNKIGRLDVSHLREWFELHTPDDYGQEYRIKQNEMQEAEQEIVSQTKDLLKEEGLNGSLVERVLQIIQNTQGLSLNINSPQRKNVSELIFNQLNQAATLEEVKAANELFKEETKNSNDKRFELLDEKEALKKRPIKSLTEEEGKRLANLDGSIKDLQLKCLEISKEFNALKSSAETRIKFENLIRNEYKEPISQTEMERIIAQKISFDSKIRALAEAKDVDFHPSETGLPSNGVEHKRRSDYASQFFSEKEDGDFKLNKGGTTAILLHMGVLEKII